MHTDDPGVVAGTPTSEGIPVRAVSRAVALLMALADGPHSLGVLAARCELSKTTAFRLLGTLATSYLVVQDENRGVYSLGPGCLRFLEAMTGPDSGLGLVAGPELEQVRRLTGETTTLHVRVGGQRICVAELPSHQPIRYTAGIGVAAPIHVGSAGKVLLGFLPPETRDMVLARVSLEPRTATTITDRQALADELATVRRIGWATSHGERIDGAVGLSVPVWDASGRLVAALSVLGPAARLDDQRLHDLLPTAISAADRIGERLGRELETVAVTTDDRQEPEA